MRVAENKGRRQITFVNSSEMATRWGGGAPSRLLSRDKRCLIRDDLKKNIKKVYLSS